MNLEDIKEVEYNDWECLSNEDIAKCPYCGYDNYIEAEYFGGQDDEKVDQCGKCERYFVHQINYTVTFTSEPYENHYLSQRRMIEHSIKTHKENLNKAKKNETDMVEHYSSIIDYKAKELTKLEKEARTYLGVD